MDPTIFIQIKPLIFGNCLGMGRDGFLPRRDETRNSDKSRQKFEKISRNFVNKRLNIREKRDRVEVPRDRNEKFELLKSRDETGRDEILVEK